MNKRIYTGLLVFLLILLGGCEKAPINSDIEGMWKLEEYTTTEDGVTHPCERIYYSIQLWVVDIAEKQGTKGYAPSIGRFAYGEDGNTVIMKDFYYRKGTTDSKEPTKLEDLQPYGLNSLETTFEIVKSDGKNMVLRSDYATLTFSKF
ncbi:lipocalin-like domain-containing protein [Phocaeicola acetigenes]|jgi:hypothetical protein|uniref:Lipocalin-like domain-containing protein n=1 Tax=Phocaeicola acetigenes TaxID=3016083 RepID=A0ABT4PEL6_9BACT|nr:lipocalin-like domain-containing protein [Phocaeicola sp. KGMB11183]MCZ8371478.1 lipocalin-like domain-containing protein [Phocaeicola sp. KGMB11183]